MYTHADMIETCERGFALCYFEESIQSAIAEIPLHNILSIQ